MAEIGKEGFFIRRCRRKDAGFAREKGSNLSSRQSVERAEGVKGLACAIVERNMQVGEVGMCGCAR